MRARSVAVSEGTIPTDHDKIRQWAEERGGRPSTVKETAPDHKAGLLRFDFGERQDRLQEIDWEEFFDTFDEANLALLNQEKTADGAVSRFHKFVSRDENTG